MERNGWDATLDFSGIRLFTKRPECKVSTAVFAFSSLQFGIEAIPAKT